MFVCVFVCVCVGVCECVLVYVSVYVCVCLERKTIKLVGSLATSLCQPKVFLFCGFSIRGPAPISN